MEMPRRKMKVAELIRSTVDTFGIEVEFCTHGSKMLSYTHIEPCLLTISATCNTCASAHEYVWKLETDADKTLELVSPILCFAQGHQGANAFKRELMAKLHDLVKGGGNTIKSLLAGLRVYLLKAARAGAFTHFDPVHAPQGVPAFALAVTFITLKALDDEMTAYNWDDTADVDGAILERREIKDDGDLQQFFLKVPVTVSKKHQGLPCPQLNRPMTLQGYVWYLANVKEPAAWRRLLLIVDKKFATQKLDKWKQAAREIDNTVSSINPKRFEQRWSAWERYWFWLVTFREMTQMALTGLAVGYGEHLPWRALADEFKRERTPEKSEIEAKKTVGSAKPTKSKGPQTREDDVVNLLPFGDTAPRELVTPTDFWPCRAFGSSAATKEKEEEGQAKKSTAKSQEREKPKDVKSGKEKRSDLLEAEVGELVSSLLYLTVQKLVAGALGALGETSQLSYQHLVMDVAKDSKAPVRPSDLLAIKKGVLDAEFMDYHSSVKDLTPMWFKGRLCDVYALVWEQHSEGCGPQIFETLARALRSLDRAALELVMEKNGSFLRDYLPGKGVPPPEKPVPNMERFLAQYQLGLESLLEHFVWKDFSFFVAREQGALADENLFLVRDNVPLWEARWDTLKPCCGDAFLVEHRNN